MNGFAGTIPLVRLALRRDRFIMPLWVGFFALIPLSAVQAWMELYPTAAAREQFVQLSTANAALIGMYGPVFGSSIGALIAWRYAVISWEAGLASFLTVIRHTRTEEELGRRDLLGSTVVGRHAPLTAALVVTGIANLALATLVALGTIVQDQPVAGSISLGLSYAAASLVFGAVGAVAAQLTQSAGAARGIAGAVLGAAFLARAVGDVAESMGNTALSWLSWVSPIGWARFTRSYAGDQWWVFALFAGAFAVLVAAAYVLSARRDVGAGLVQPRLGRAEASPGLRTPLALAWRLHKGLLIGWAAGLGVTALFIGGLLQAVSDMVEQSPGLARWFEALGGRAALIDSATAGMMGFFGLFVCGYTIQATLRMRTEEVNVRAEPVLAVSVSRWSWAGSHLFFAFLGSAFLLALSGGLAGLTYGLISGDVAAQMGRVLASAMVQLPAVWILTGLSMALFGLLPRWSAAAWGALGAVVFLNVFGELLRLPQWTLDISPFAHLPKFPSEEVTAAPVVWLTVIVIALTAAGLAGFRRRDVGF